MGRGNYMKKSGDCSSKSTTLLQFPSLFILQVALLGGLLSWAYVAVIKRPLPKICGTPGGPPVTSPRIRLSDGRHLAYKEAGVSKEVAKYKIIIIHGFASSKDIRLPISQELVDELQIYLLSYDRAGYGESDPYPKRSVKTEAYDIQELADKLQIGDKFYVLGYSMGGYPVWSCLKYIPHRLSGVSLIAPLVNYWWHCFPSSLAKEGFSTQLVQDQWTFRVAHYAPWLFNWWMTQKWFPSSSMMEGNSAIYSRTDVEILKILPETPLFYQEKIRQQGDFESLFRDAIAGYGKWEFDPTDLNPFPKDEGLVHIWQGFEDRVIPYKLHRFLAQKLPWIRYHEVPDGGHFFVYNESYCEAIVRALVLE